MRNGKLTLECHEEISSIEADANAVCMKELLPGEDEVPPPILADPAYPLLPNVIKEHSTCTTNEEVIFNEMLQSARHQTGCAFGRLKARW